jgi:hypothetical protein
VRRATLAVLVWGLFVCAAVPAAAQSAATTPPPDAPMGVTFIPRYAFHLNGEHLSTDDERFRWDANYGGELDVVDYVRGRFTFFANYQVITGEEFRAFDPTQGNYILGGRLSYRLRGVELAGVFYHQSRHLSDRPKRQAVDWNMFGGRASRPFTVGRVALDTRVDIRGVVEHSFVDYQWELDGGVHARYPLARHIALVGDADLRLLGTDGSQDRGTQTGARGEGGVRFQGKAGAIELFVAGERRIDPYPLEFGTMTWFSAGFKLLSP